jgi:hypothetical protein
VTDVHACAVDLFCRAGRACYAGEGLLSLKKLPKQLLGLDSARISGIYLFCGSSKIFLSRVWDSRYVFIVLDIEESYVKWW